MPGSERGEELPELPPLDLDERDEDGPVGRLDELFEAPDPTEEGGNEDEVPLDIDVGVKLDSSEENSADAGTGELVLDIATLLQNAEERIEPDADETGIAALDPSLDIESSPEIGLDEPEEDGSDDMEELVSDQLPGLDADEEGEFDGDAEASFIEGASARDEVPPPWARTRWTGCPPPTRSTPLRSVGACWSPAATTSCGSKQGLARCVWLPAAAESSTSFWSVANAIASFTRRRSGDSSADSAWAALSKSCAVGASWLVCRRGVPQRWSSARCPETTPKTSSSPVFPTACSCAAPMLEPTGSGSSWTVPRAPYRGAPHRRPCCCKAIAPAS
jgi:hypothetical protein